MFQHPEPFIDSSVLDYKKTPEQMAVIRYANEETNRLMQEAGVEPYDIPDSQYCIFSKENLEKMSESSGAIGVNSPLKPFIGISIETTSSLVRFASSVFHEILHAKAMRVYDVSLKDDGGPHITVVRKGIVVNSSQEQDREHKSYSYFEALDEAIVEWQTKLFIPKVLNLPELSREKEMRLSSSFKERVKKEFEKGTDSSDELKCFGEDGKAYLFGYYSARKILEYVCREVSNQFGTRCPDVESVCREFLKVNFTCDHKTVIDLVDGTFGKGAFHLLEKIPKTDDDSAHTIDYYCSIFREKLKAMHEMSAASGLK